MVSLQERLISEISLSNPKLSPQEVSNQITTLIENEILPWVLSRIRLPHLPSPLSVKREELMRPRYGKLVAKRSLQEKVSFIQDLEKLRLKYDGSGLTNEDLLLGLMDNSQALFAQEMRHDVEPNGKVLPVKSDIIQEGLKSTPSSERMERITKKPFRLINFDTSINEKIARDPSFEKVVGKIESKIRRNYDRETLNIYFKFSTRTDIDDPEREKTIIHISLPTHSFDEKMEFWDKIEADIRDEIKKLSVSRSEKKAINRNMFTHVEPA